jgi:hypothetical protein
MISLMMNPAQGGRGGEVSRSPPGQQKQTETQSGNFRWTETQSGNFIRQKHNLEILSDRNTIWKF